MSIVRTRFAPSPTGYMHIGGMRTALFNWLWARHNQGQFILRIDDTDQQRNVETALGPILDAFRWLGLDWDEGPDVGGPHGPYFQSQRMPLYQAACEELLASHQAYKDFDPPELIQADRSAAEQEKRQYVNIRRSLDLSASQIEQYEAEGRPYVVRFLVDRSRNVCIDDHVRGHVKWAAGLITDPVIMRSNGTPLYNFASVVDDAQMQITHVIRAEEHLSNTPVQVLLFNALGKTVPEFAHIPFVAGPDGKKISKREKYVEKLSKHQKFRKLFQIADDLLPQIGQGSSEKLNPVMVAYYEAVGFLPEAVLNGLSRLGWSYDDKTEQMPLAFIVDNFTLDRVVKSAAALDPDKLLAYQEYWIGQLSLAEKIERCLPYLVAAGLTPENVSGEEREFIGRVISALGERIKLFSDIIGYDEYFVDDDKLAYDQKAFQKRIAKPEQALALLRRFRDVLQEADDFTAAALESALKTWVEAEEISIGQIIHALRVAVSGKPAGPGMFDCLELLGKERCLNRIDQAIALAEDSSD